jgi:sucrose synthase
MLLVSVHGWFAQSDVLGRPDTGGQVVYVLDQARALESYLRGIWREAGIDVLPQIVILTRLIPEAEGTTCDVRREKVKGTENAYILRVPFRHANGAVHPHWISRFQVWPFLNRFAQDAFHEVQEEFDGEAPDQIIGNYADGNMVASVMGREWQAPIAVIAHALEKTKYLMSDLYWRDVEQEYRFSIHFLSDILAANSADFIITSSYQEIAGTPKELGQYESYEVFTLPGRYRVLSGVNVKSARFVINPPGVDTTLFHPFINVRSGEPEAEAQIEALVNGEAQEDAGIVGRFADPDKPIIFTMARMDRIKNLTGLVQVYARRQALREAANLLILSGVTLFEDSADHEEQQQIARMYRLLEQYGLHDQVRWLPGHYGLKRVPHYYRFVARRRGVFVQPALFEAFGLTVLEAMATGLPVVATRFGGPASIIEDRQSGFLIDPNHAAEVEKAVLTVLSGSTDDGGRRWDEVSHAGVRRVHEHFSWPGHARRLVASHGVYNVWSHIFPERRKVRRSYVDALHHFLFGRLIEETWPE